MKRKSTLVFKISTVILMAGLFLFKQEILSGFPFSAKNSFAKAQTKSTAVDKSFFAPAACPGPGLIISEFFTNPSGSDSPFEFVELRATRAINFAATPYSVVFTDNGSATANGWIEGGARTYGFSITTGAVNVGDVVYVGGSSMTPTGTKLRTINTANTGGDRFGNAATGGVLGNGGGNADSLGVFDVGINSLTAATVPIDAIFFGTTTGTAVVSGGTAGFQLPVNDRYNGGKLQSNSYLAPDPATDQYITATGIFDLGSCAFTSARTWTASTTLTDGTSSVTLTTANAPTISENTATPFLNLPATGAGFVSGVISDLTDPARTIGLDFTFADSDTPIASLTVAANSNNQTVVPNANLALTGSGTNRNLKITPAASGYATISVTVSDGISTATYTVNYAASTASATPSTTVYHTGKSDASTAIAIDANYMFVGDDEDQALRLYDRRNSGLPLNSFDFTSSLGLTDIGGGIPREVDIEASTQIGNRIYWLGSHSNASSGNLRPDRYRLFATDISGTGAAATLSYVGRYDGLRTDLINWDTSNAHGLGANYFGLQASAANGVIPEDASGGGFNIEGLTIAPDGATGWIAFRAPIVPANSRTQALILPVANFAALVSGNPTTATTATFGAPIQLNLGGRGIREIKKNTANEYLIIAGSFDGTPDFRLYTWNGNPSSQPILRTAELTGLNPEGIVEVPSNLGGANQVQLISDNGDSIYYNDGIIAKDLPNAEFKKFRSDIVSISVAPTAAVSTVSGRVLFSQSSHKPVFRASVTLTDPATGETKTVRTDRAGSFTFTEVNSGGTYILEIKYPLNNFQPQIITVNSDIGGLIFYSL